jgi:hypothetical protein
VGDHKGYGTGVVPNEILNACRSFYHGHCWTMSGITSTVVFTDRPTRHCV